VVAQAERASEAGSSHSRETGSSEERPLGAYAVLAGAFGLAFGAPLLVAERRDALPERLPAADLALLGVGTFKLSRLVTQDAVTGFLRAPFVRFEGMEGISDPKESPRRGGMRGALGQLLLCPGCTGMWIAAGLTAGLLVAPRSTRVACGTLAALTASDFLQAAHRAAHPS
jgi:hypothetical protein